MEGNKPSNNSLLQSWELVDIGPPPESSDKGASKSPPNSPPSADQKTKPSNSQPTKTLCGYLSKQGGVGIIKTWKTRWFVFDDVRSTLFFYRNSQDFVPLGHIDISVASLSFDLENVDKGQFEIKSEDKIFYLQADTKASMMFWLNQLQAKRKASSRLRRLLESSQNRDELSGLANMPRLAGTQTLEDRLAERASPADVEGVPGAPPPKPADWSLSSLKEDFRSVGRRLNTANTKSTEVREAAQAAAKRKATWTKYESEGREVALEATKEETSDAPASTPATPPTAPAEASRTQPAAAPAPTAPTRARSSPASPSQSPVLSKSPAAQTPQEGTPSQGMSRGRLSKSKLGTLFTPGRWSGRDQRPAESEGERPQSSSTASQVTSAGGEQLACHRCAAHEQRIATLQEEVDILETEVSARQRLIHDFHQQLAASQAMLRSSEQFIASADEQSRVQLLCSKDEEIAKLQSSVERKTDELDRGDVLLVKLRREISDLGEQCKLYQETLMAKDEVVISLSNELFNMKNQKLASGSSPGAPVDLRSNSPTQAAAQQTTIAELKLQVEKLKDTCSAYKLQNDFLNTEIVELDQLRQDDKKLIASQTSEIVSKEAAYLKLHSNHLIILQEMQKPQIGGMQYDADAGTTQEMVTRLLEDAMDTNVYTSNDVAPKSSEDDKHDRYGFAREELKSAAAKATVLHRRGRELELLEGGHRARWEAYMKSRGTARRFDFGGEVKSLIRQGIPAEFRTEVWRDLIYARVQDMMQTKGAGYYQSLHQMSDSKGSLVYKQIELDLLRTLPGNKYYNTPDAAGVSRLRRLLRAFAWHNPIIGYCQGLNRLAAIALLVLNEEDAFWCLVLIVDFLMPKTYYSKTLMASQVDQRVLKDLLAMKLPRLATHLDNHCIDIGLITFNWFLTIFVDNVPFETVLHIWDSFLYEGCKVLFRFALGVFKLNEEALLQLEDTAQIFQQMREMANAIPDNTTLAQASFVGLNPFPMRVINKQRALHTAVVKDELAEMETLRSSHQVATFESQRNDPALLVFSDDDEI